MADDKKDKKVPVKDVEKGLKAACAELEKDLKGQKIDPKTAKLMRCKVEDAMKQVSKDAKAKADKSGMIDPPNLAKVQKKASKFSFTIEVTQEEATFFQDQKIKFKPKFKYKVSKDVSLSFKPMTVEYKSQKVKAYASPTFGVTFTFP